jgi:hypothetical protein
MYRHQLFPITDELPASLFVKIMLHRGVNMRFRIVVADVTGVVMIPRYLRPLGNPCAQQAYSFVVSSRCFLIASNCFLILASRKKYNYMPETHNAPS